MQHLLLLLSIKPVYPRWIDRALTASERSKDGYRPPLPDRVSFPKQNASIVKNGEKADEKKKQLCSLIHTSPCQCNFSTLSFLLLHFGLFCFSCRGALIL